MLTPDQYKQARELFVEARALPPDAWAGFLDAAGLADDDVLKEVLTLLKVDQSDDTFLRTPAVEQDFAMDAAEALLVDDEVSLVGRAIH